MLFLFLFSPFSFESYYEVLDANSLNDTIDDYGGYVSQPLIKYPEASDNQRKYLSDLKSLYDNLMSDYEKNLSPVFSNTSNPHGFTIPPMVVNIIASGVTILGMDDTAQILHLNMMIDFKWTDERLSWNSSQYSDIRSLDMRREEIWMPDVSPYRCQTMNEFSPKSMQTVHVNYKGIANYRMQVDLRCLCYLELEDYPFDRQTCDIQFFVFQHLSDTIILEADSWPSEGWLIGSDAWSIVNFTNTSWLFFGNSGAANFTIELERTYGFFITFIIFPTTLLSSICILAMFYEKIDRNNRLEKIGIGVATLAAITLILNIIADEIPRKRTTSVIAKFILANLCTLTVAILVVIINPIGILESHLSKRRIRSNKISPASLTTDSLTRVTSKSTPKTKKSRIESCLVSDKIILVLFEAAVFAFFGLVAAFWST